VTAALDAAVFKECLLGWVETLHAREPDMIAIDGKTSRRSHARRKGRLPLHTVSAWATRQRLVLGREAVVEKSNEIPAIPLLLQRLELTGALVTIDAMGTRSPKPSSTAAETTCCRSSASRGASATAIRGRMHRVGGPRGCREGGSPGRFRLDYLVCL
jgi:hypothetical protein